MAVVGIVLAGPDILGCFHAGGKAGRRGMANANVGAGRGVCPWEGGPRILVIGSGEADGTQVPGGIRRTDVSLRMVLGEA